MIRSLLVILTGLSPLPALGEPVSFRRDIAPILSAQCQSCHGPKKAKGGYRVDTFTRAMSAGSSDAPAFTAHSLDESEAFYRITTEDEEDRMPLESDPLSSQEIALFKQWIEQGTKFDGDDPDVPLSLVQPDVEHPRAPDTYALPIPITALAFSHNGEELYVSGLHEITVWSTSQGTLLRRIGNQGERTYALAIHPTEPWLAVAGGNPGRLGELRVFHSETGQLLQVLAKTTDVALTTAFSPEGDQLAVGSSDGFIRIHALPDYHETLVLTNHSDWVTSLAWNAKGDRLASGSRDKTAKVFQLPAGNRLTTYAGHEKAVQGLFFHQDNAEIYSASADGSVDCWSISEGKRSRQLDHTLGQVFSLSASSTQVFATTNKGTIVVFGLADDTTTTWSHHQDNWIISSAYDASHDWLATGDDDGNVRLWDAKSGDCQLHFVAYPSD